MSPSRRRAASPAVAHRRGAWLSIVHTLRVLHAAALSAARCAAGPRTRRDAWPPGLPARAAITHAPRGTRIYPRPRGTQYSHAITHTQNSPAHYRAIARVGLRQESREIDPRFSRPSFQNRMEIRQSKGRRTPPVFTGCSSLAGRTTRDGRHSTRFPAAASAGTLPSMTRAYESFASTRTT